MRIDLWSKDMPVEEMNRFHIDCIGGLAQSILTSTGDEFMASEINALCERLVIHLKTKKD
jgi:gliding motility-associated protein GldC